MKFKYSKEELIRAYNSARNNKRCIQESETCVCFACKNRFYSYEIDHWIVGEQENTALCPYCYIEAVLAEKARYSITEEFLTAMNEYWYQGNFDVGLEAWFFCI